MPETPKDVPTSEWRDIVPAIVILSVAIVGCVLFTAWLLNEKGIVEMRLDGDSSDVPDAL